MQKRIYTAGTRARPGHFMVALVNRCAQHPPLAPISLFRSKSGRECSSYEPQDRQLMKSLLRPLYEWITPHVPQSCTHLKGRGGYKGALSQIKEAIESGQYTHVCRSDVRQFYNTIDPYILLRQLRPLIPFSVIRKLIAHVLFRCVHRNGVYRRLDYGVPAGCSLSPLFGALYLSPLDHAMIPLQRKGLFYVRYMDDWVILAKNRYQLREAVRRMNQVLGALKQEKHPDKTFIGKLSRRFDAFGEAFDETGALGMTRQVIRNFAEQIMQRYAQQESRESLACYVNRWTSAKECVAKMPHTFASTKPLTGETNEKSQTKSKPVAMEIHSTR